VPQYAVPRFTKDEHERGDTTGRRFEARWFRRVSGLEWAYFTKETHYDEAHEDDP
jgi:hypothetical protein